MWTLWKDLRDARRLRPSAGFAAQARLALCLSRWRSVRRAETARPLPAGFRGVAASLAGVAAAAGAIELARWARHAVSARLGLDPSGDSLLFAYGFAISLVAGAALGLWPVLVAARRDLRAAGSTALPPGMRGVSPVNAIAAAQAAVWIFLLVGSGLFIRDLHTSSSNPRLETWNALHPKWELKLADWDGGNRDAADAKTSLRTE